MMRDIQVSVVVHSQCDLAQQLFMDLAGLDSHRRIQATLVKNIPDNFELKIDKLPFPVRVIENLKPQGFAANHNLAYRNAVDKEQRRYFAVLNPDLRIEQDIFIPLIQELDARACAGVIAPKVVTPELVSEDSVRELPTPARIFAKLFGKRGMWSSHQELAHPDWLAGMFMMFPADVFNKLGGFDERYFLYYEDVELCSRLWLNGYQVIFAPQVEIIHFAQRASRRKLKYLYWHLSSMFRFFTSPTYAQVKALHRQRQPKG